MEEPGGPQADGAGRRGLVLAVALALATAAGLIALLARDPGVAPNPTPAPAARPAVSPRPLPSVRPAEPAEARPRAEASARSTSPASRLRVEADVPGANVFLDRRFLGTTPLETSDFEPGTHRLNVSAEGYEMYAEAVELTAGPNAVSVRFKEVRLDEHVAVSHKHGVGSCRGELRASRSGLSFVASKPADSFDAPFASLEPLEVDYLARNLRVKLKGGKTWNFTSDDADALLVFQKKVEAARARL
jgi:hypothetical protein